MFGFKKWRKDPATIMLLRVALINRIANMLGVSAGYSGDLLIAANPDAAYDWQDSVLFTGGIADLVNSLLDDIR